MAQERFRCKHSYCFLSLEGHAIPEVRTSFLPQKSQSFISIQVIIVASWQGFEA